MFDIPMYEKAGRQPVLNHEQNEEQECKLLHENFMFNLVHSFPWYVHLKMFEAAQRCEGVGVSEQVPGI